MKLHRLVGLGPVAAFVSAGALTLFFFVLVFGNSIAQAEPAIAFPLGILWFLSAWMWVAAFAVVVFDLEWLEHPATSTTWFKVAHWMTLVAIFWPPVLGVAAVINSQLLGTLAMIVLGLTVGVSLLIHSLDAQRAGLISGPLPWLGVLSGGAFVLLALGEVGVGIVAFVGLFAGEAFYIAWAVWMGVWLSRSRQAVPMATPALAGP